MATAILVGVLLGGLAAVLWMAVRAGRRAQRLEQSERALDNARTREKTEDRVAGLDPAGRDKLRDKWRR